MIERERYEQALAKLQGEGAPQPKQINLWLSPELRARLGAEVKRRGATISKVIRAALEACLPEG